MVHGITHLFAKKLNGKVFGGFIVNARTDRYNTISYIDAYERKHQSYSCGDGIIAGSCTLPSNSTTSALESLGETIYFIGCWLPPLEHNFIERCHMYTHYTK